MNKLTRLMLVLVFLVSPLTLSADEGPGRRCNGHMCPIARSATDIGYKTVAKLPIVNVLEGEFLA